MNNFDVNFFLDLESKVWAALASGDRQADASLLADDFLGVYSTGTAGKAEHAAQLIHGPPLRNIPCPMPKSGCWQKAWSS